MVSNPGGVCKTSCFCISAKYCTFSPDSTVGTASAFSVESDPRCTSQVYFDNVTLTSQNHADSITSVTAAKQPVTIFHITIAINEV